VYLSHSFLVVVNSLKVGSVQGQYEIVLYVFGLPHQAKDSLILIYVEGGVLDVSVAANLDILNFSELLG
jgi:hypothetical protein